MLQMQREQTVAEFVFCDPLFHFAGEFQKSAPARLNCQFVKMLPKHFGMRGLVRALKSGGVPPQSMIYYWFTGTPLSASIFSRSGLRGWPASSAF